MFGAIDSPGHRTLSCQALDGSGAPCWIMVVFNGEGPLSSASGRLLRTRPTGAHARRVAEALLVGQFLPPGEARRVLVGRLQEDNPEADLDFLIPPEERGKPIYRMRGPKDPPADSPVRLKAVRLFLWRIRGDPKDCRFRREAIGDPVEAGDWKTP